MRVRAQALLAFLGPVTAVDQEVFGIFIALLVAVWAGRRVCEAVAVFRLLQVGCSVKSEEVQGTVFTSCPVSVRQRQPSCRPAVQSVLANVVPVVPQPPVVSLGVQRGSWVFIARNFAEAPKSDRPPVWSQSSLSAGPETRSRALQGHGM